MNEYPFFLVAFACLIIHEMDAWSLALPAQDNLASKEIGEDIEKQHIGSRAKT